MRGSGFSLLLPDASPSEEPPPLTRRGAPAVAEKVGLERRLGIDLAKVATACAVVMTCVMLFFCLGLLRRLVLASSPVSVVTLTAVPPVPPRDLSAGEDALPLKEEEAKIETGK